MWTFRRCFAGRPCNQPANRRALAPWPGDASPLISTSLPAVKACRLVTVADPSFEGLANQGAPAAPPPYRSGAAQPQQHAAERQPALPARRPLEAPSTQSPQTGTRDRAVSTYLINSIMTARTWQQLAELAHANAPSFNHVHISALVCRLPKLVPSPHSLEASERGRFSRFLGEVSELVAQRLPTFDPRAVANVLWAVCKLGYSPAPPLLNQFLFEAYVRMDKFNAQELANLSWALATLAAMGRQPVPAWLRKFMAAAGPHVNSLKPQELAHMAWALSRLCPTPEGSQAVAAAGGAAMPAYSSAGSPYAESLPALVSALCRRAAACMHRFTNGELVMAVTALHRLDPAAARSLAAAALPHLLRACSLPPAGAASSAGGCDSRGVRASASSSNPPPPSSSSWRCDLSGQDLANMWFVLGRSVVLADPPPAGPGAGSAGKGQEPAAPGRGSPAAAAVEAAAPPAPVPRHHLYALVEVTGRSAHLLTAQGLCMVLVAFARLQMRPSADTARALLQRFHQVLPAQSSFQAVSVSLWALARLDLRPGAATMELLLHCAALQAPAAKPHELLALLWALTRLGFCPPAACLGRLGARLAVLAPLLRPHGLQVVVAAYSAFGARLPQGVRDAVLAAAGAHIGGATTPTGRASAEAGVRRRLGGLEDVRQPAEMAVAQKEANEEVRGPRGMTASLDVFAELQPSSAVRLLATLAGVSVRWAPSSRGRAAAKHSAAQLRARLAPRRHALTRGLQRATGGHLAGLSTDALCALLLSLSRLRMRPRAAYLVELRAVLEARAAQLAPWQAGGLLTALARLRLLPPGAWLQRVLAGLEGSYEQLSGRQLLGLAHALAGLRFRPTATWMAKYLQHCLARQEEWPVDGLRRLLRSLGELGLHLRGRPCLSLQALVRANRGELLHVVGARHRAHKAAAVVAARGLAAARAGRAGRAGGNRDNKGSGVPAGMQGSVVASGDARGVDGRAASHQGPKRRKRVVLRTTDAGATGLGGGVRLQLPGGGSRAAARAMAADAGLMLKRSLCKVCVDLEQCAL